MNHIPAFNEVFKVLFTDREVCIRERSEESCDNFDSEQGPMSGLQFWITLGFINIIKIVFNWYHYHYLSIIIIIIIIIIITVIIIIIIVTIFERVWYLQAVVCSLECQKL